MNGANIAGTFIRQGDISDAILSFQPAAAATQTLMVGFTVDIIGLDASNTVKLQKSTDNGITWVDVVTYNANQVKTQITEATNVNAQHRLICLAKQAITVTGVPIQFKMTKELPTNRSTPPG